MKRFAFIALLAALCFGVASSASATELKVKGNLDVYGIWSSNLMDFDSDTGDGDNYATTQRMRTYFTFLAHENLKAVLGLEMDHIWGQRTGSGGRGAQWGTDGRGDIEIKHAYLDFNFPDTAINVKAGLQNVALPGVFGNPVFDDDAAALVVSAPINDMVGVSVGYTRGEDNSDNFDTGAAIVDRDDVDMAFLAVPVTLDGFGVTPYFIYARAGMNTNNTNLAAPMGDDAKAWVLGANAELTMFDPLTFEADLIYGDGYTNDNNFRTHGWYAALKASYKFDMLTASLFGTYATGVDSNRPSDARALPTLREDWGLTPYIGGRRAFSTGFDSFFTDYVATAGNDISAGVGLWTIGLDLNDISFVDNLSHRLMIVYAQGTSDDDAFAPNRGFSDDDSAFEVYLTNKYMIYENLAAINELGLLAPDFDDNGPNKREDDASYYGTIGFQYKF